MRIRKRPSEALGDYIEFEFALQGNSNQVYSLRPKVVHEISQLCEKQFLHSIAIVRREVYGGDCGIKAAKYIAEIIRASVIINAFIIEEVLAP